MAKRKEIQIRTESYVTVNGVLTNTKDLTEAQKVKLATWIKLTWCQELYRGKAVFWVKGETPPPGAQPPAT